MYIYIMWLKILFVPHQNEGVIFRVKLQNWQNLILVKEESEKVGLKLNIQKTKIMASGLITSWQIDMETVETVSDFILGRLQNHCRWWLQATKLKDAYSLEGKLWPN